MRNVEPLPDICSPSDSVKRAVDCGGGAANDGAVSGGEAGGLLVAQPLGAVDRELHVERARKGQRHTRSPETATRPIVVKASPAIKHSSRVSISAM